jgi:protein O-GlcNAc transferase
MTERPGPSDLDQCLCWQEGEIHLNVPDGVLPGFLIEAHNYTCSDSRAEAQALLSEVNLERVEQLAEQRYHGITLIYLLLGMVYQRLGLLKTARQWYERTLAQQAHALVYAELASLCAKQLLYGQALAAFEKALALAPELTHLTERYPDYLAMTGRIQEAVALLQKRVDTGDIDPHVHSSLLIYLHYVPQISTAELVAAHRRWGRTHVHGSSAGAARHQDLDPERRLRIGFLSADFRQHSVAYTFEAFLDGRDSDQLELWGYGSVACPDHVTERIRTKFDRYRSIFELDDKALADLIASDQIDILVALAGYTSGHRLGVLAFQPAPIQVDSGSLATLGMEQVKYRLTDQWLDPLDTQEHYLEEFVHLPGGSICYRPAENAPPVKPSPALDNGYITFGSFNSRLKLNDDVISLWSQVLKVVPESRLLLKFPGSHDSIMANDMRERFHGQGIASERVLIQGYCRSFEEHMRCYHAVDIALDTYPFNGGVTILEGLWMGVPLISLVGERFALRTGLQVLTQLDMGYFATRTPKEYLAKARALASQVESLAKLRATLRGRMQASSLCDSQRYARELEVAYRMMWQRYCHQYGAGAATGDPACTYSNREGAAQP